ncbi:MAG: ABC transporter substrate-binding protein [Alphaproteobacteria bacterium]|nr:MAG: ABC transporter substrate-binding protein [Alphaproteobacteria bacterium]
MRRPRLASRCSKKVSKARAGPSAKIFASSTAMPKAIPRVCRRSRKSWWSSSRTAFSPRVLRSPPRSCGPRGPFRSCSLPSPIGNITGFTVLHASIAGKYLEMLKEMVPQLVRVAIMYNPNSVPAGGRFFSRPFHEAATKLKVQPITAEVHDNSAIENAITTLGRESGSGLILVPDNFMSVHRDLIISLTAEFRIPAIFPYRYFAEAGGLVSYGVDAIDQFRRASEYVSRILRGTKPADLPVQAPTKFELVINLRTAKELGLVIPRILLAGAKQVIE